MMLLHAPASKKVKVHQKPTIQRKECTSWKIYELRQAPLIELKNFWTPLRLKLKTSKRDLSFLYVAQILHSAAMCIHGPCTRCHTITCFLCFEPWCTSLTLVSFSLDDTLLQSPNHTKDPAHPRIQKHQGKTQQCQTLQMLH